MVKAPELFLVQGFVANITREELYTTDADTPPEGILYQIVNAPNNGYIVRADDPDTEINSFTQKDIDDNKVGFHSNSLSTPGS